MFGPTRMARLNPIVGSYGDPDVTRWRSVTGMRIEWDESGKRGVYRRALADGARAIHAGSSVVQRDRRAPLDSGADRPRRDPALPPGPHEPDLLRVHRHECGERAELCAYGHRDGELHGGARRGKDARRYHAADARRVRYLPRGSRQGRSG